MFNLNNCDIRCDFCSEMEDVDDLKLCTPIGLDYGVLYENVDKAKFCPVCGRRLPESED